MVVSVCQEKKLMYMQLSTRMFSAAYLYEVLATFCNIDNELIRLIIKEKSCNPPKLVQQSCEVTIAVKGDRKLTKT